MIHDDTIHPGTLLGRFRIEELAGRGGMGDVYQAYDTALERRVALKRLRLDVADPVALARFRREAQSLAQLNHPCVCQVYDYAETDRGLFIAMEWVEGDTLPKLMGWPRTPLPPRRVVSILRGIAEALAAAHAKGIVHRDLKPSNVMVTADDAVKVLDFGLAKGSALEEEEVPPPPPPVPENAASRFLAAARGEDADLPTLSSGAREPLTQAGLFMGTPGYASPEQARGRWVTAASDVFGLGILGHELLTGLRPFPGDGEDQLRAVVKNKRTEVKPPLGSRRLWTLIERMLQPRPKDRPTAAEVAEALADLEAPKGLPWWGAGAAVVLVAFLGGLLWLRGRGVIADLAKERPARVVVARIHNATGDPKLDAVVQTGLPALLAQALQDSPRLSVIDPDTLQSVASRLTLDLQKATDKDLSRLGANLGAALILKGDLTRDPAHQEDRLHLVLTDQDGRIRYQGSVAQPIRSEFLPQALLYPAADHLLKAVDPWGESGKPRPKVPDQIFTEYAQGMDLVTRGEFGQAEPFLYRAAYGAPDFAQGVGAYAVCLRLMGRPEAGPASFWAIYSARQSGDRYGEVFGLSALASWALDQRDLDRASTAYTQALALAEAYRDLDRQSTALNGLGRVAQARGDLKGAEARYQQALLFAQQTGNRVQQGQVLANLANLALGAGNLTGAERRYREGLAMAQEIGDLEGQSLELNNIGVVLLTQLRPEEALAPLSRALELRRSIHAAQGELSSLRNLGIAYLMKNEPDEATRHFQASLELARNLKNGYAAGKALFYLGETELQQGHFDQGLPYFRECSELLQQASAPVARAEALAGAAVCLIRSGKGASAEAGRLLAETTRTAPRDPFVLRARAWSAQAAGRPVEALELFDQALQDPTHAGPEIHGDLQKAFRQLAKS